MNKLLLSKHFKRIPGICIVIMLIFLSGVFAEVKVKAAETSSTPHYYATALKEFIRDATGKTTAVLYDLDGCGHDEMIAFDEGITIGEHWGELSEGARITVFDFKSGSGHSTGIEPEITRASYKVYIANKNDLVIYDQFEGYSYHIYIYDNRALKKQAVLVDGSYANSTFYSIDGIECNKSKFDNKLKELNVDNINVAVGTGYFGETWYEGWKPVTDDTSKILAMAQSSSVNPSAITVILNGTPIQFDQPPIIENGRTLVPLRAIFEALGAEVDWNSSTQTVTANKEEVTITLKIGSDILVKNCDEIKLDVPAKIINNRTLVPVRVIAESFGAEVDWEQSTRTVTITE